MKSTHRLAMLLEICVKTLRSLKRLVKEDFRKAVNQLLSNRRTFTERKSYLVAAPFTFCQPLKYLCCICRFGDFNLFRSENSTGCRDGEDIGIRIGLYFRKNLRRKSPFLGNLFKIGLALLIYELFPFCHSALPKIR